MSRKDDNPEWIEKDFAEATKLKPGTSLIEATEAMVAKRALTDAEEAEIPRQIAEDPDDAEATEEQLAWPFRISSTVAFVTISPAASISSILA